jgi:hypothetical protein
LRAATFSATAAAPAPATIAAASATTIAATSPATIAATSQATVAAAAVVVAPRIGGLDGGELEFEALFFLAASMEARSASLARASWYSQIAHMPPTNLAARPQPSSALVHGGPAAHAAQRSPAAADARPQPAAHAIGGGPEGEAARLTTCTVRSPRPYTTWRRAVVDWLQPIAAER